MLFYSFQTRCRQPAARMLTLWKKSSWLSRCFSSYSHTFQLLVNVLDSAKSLHPSFRKGPHQTKKENKIPQWHSLLMNQTISGHKLSAQCTPLPSINMLTKNIDIVRTPLSSIRFHRPTKNLYIEIITHSK